MNDLDASNVTETANSPEIASFGNPNNLFIEIMASCHSLTSIQDRLIGDPLEIIMFQHSNWALNEQNPDKYDELVLAVVKPSISKAVLVEDPSLIDKVTERESIAVMKRFEFSARL